MSLGGGVEGKEIVANGNIIVPPYGTTARRYMGVLGTRRLELGDGYGIHGTDHPESIGSRSATAACACATRTSRSCTRWSRSVLPSTSIKKGVWSRRS